MRSGTRWCNMATEPAQPAPFNVTETASFWKKSAPYSATPCILHWSGLCLDCFLLEYSTAQRAYPLANWMSWILEIFHHLWRTKIPLATMFGCISLIPLAFVSGSQECPVSIVKIWGILFDLPWSNSTKTSLSFFSRTMSLNIDMKIIRSLIFSGVMFFPCKSAWILWRMSNALAPGKIFHSKSIGSPSNPLQFSEDMTYLQSWHLIIPPFDCIFWTMLFSQA